MLKILQAKLQQYMNGELPGVQARFRKDRGTEIKLPTSIGSLKKEERSRKTSTSVLLTMPKSLTVWITTNWKILQDMGISDHLTCFLRNLYAGQEATIRTGQLGSQIRFLPPPHRQTCCWEGFQALALPALTYFSPAAGQTIENSSCVGHDLSLTIYYNNYLWQPNASFFLSSLSSFSLVCFIKTMSMNSTFRWPHISWRWTKDEPEWQRMSLWVT